MSACAYRKLQNQCGGLQMFSSRLVCLRGCMFVQDGQALKFRGWKCVHAKPLRGGAWAYTPSFFEAADGGNTYEIKRNALACSQPAFKGA